MWERDWALLGIEPTPELAAIKKAYALKLKATRPDDDAEAYQALRAAYERAQQWARSPGDATAAAGAPVTPAAAPETLPTAPLRPAETMQRLHTLWQQQGSPALLAEWPSVHTLLDAQPLDGRAAWSAHFAHWVVHEPELPDAFVDALDGYFGWREDFRVERQIGMGLAEAVRQALQRRADRPEPADAALMEQVQPLRRLHGLRNSGKSVLWLALLLQPMMSRLLTGLDLRTLGLCGIDPPMRRSLDQQLQMAWLLRLALLGGLVLTMFLLVSDERDLALLRMTMWCLWGTGWLAVSHLGGLVMHHGLALERGGGRTLSVPLQRWRRHPRQPAAGLGLLVAAMVLAAFAQGGDLTTATLPVPDHITALLQLLLNAAPWLLLWLGALLAWPLRLVLSPISIGLLVPVGALLFRAAAPGDPWAAVVTLALLYVLVGAARFEDRLGSNTVLDAVCRPVTHTLAMAVRWGWPFALLPSLLTLAFLFSSRPHPPVPGLVLCWMLATLALHQLQHRTEAWALRKLNRD